ncbi:PDZ domain-containing protein [Ignavibacteria bacterium]|nr:M61 family metallopeptidase [Bacteroidota bacterium]MCZ2132659.1 PDZ domain-containing protein [Bacteroidota bacterium]
MNYSIEQTDAELIGTTAAIRYHLHFGRAAQHLVEIQMEIDNTAAEITLTTPSWMPGSYKIRDMSSNQGNFTVTDDEGKSLKFQWLSKNSVRIEANGKNIRVNYLYYANERGVRTSHVNRFHAFIVPTACFMYVEGRQYEVHHVALHHNRTEWKTATSSLSPVKYDFENDELIVLGALNYDILADSPIEIGNHSTATFTVGSALHEVALIADKKYDINWLAGLLRQIVVTERKFWGELPYDRYVFMLLVGDGQRGGLEHARCNVSAVEPQAFSDYSAAQDMVTLLAHEYFHTWNIKRIRPVELGPFNYSSENYTQALWLAEGITSYYDRLLAYRSGFLSREEYLGSLSANSLERLDRVPGRFAMSVRDSSFLAWTKLYSLSPDMNNRFPSYYLKGGIAALLLDMHIIAETKGAKRLDDGMRALWAAYKKQPERGFTETEVLDIFEEATAVKCGELFMSWLDSSDELPYNKVMNRLGLQYLPKEISDIAETVYTENTDLSFPPAASALFVGISLKEEAGRLLVREIEDGAPAAQAGIGIDDEIVFVNGFRVQTSRSFIDALQQTGAGVPAQITGSCDGKAYSAAITPRSAAANEIRVMPGATPECRALLEIWLAR